VPPFQLACLLIILLRRVGVLVFSECPLGDIGSDAEDFLKSSDTRPWRGVYLEDASQGDEAVASALYPALRLETGKLLASHLQEAARPGTRAPTARRRPRAHRHPHDGACRPTAAAACRTTPASSSWARARPSSSAIASKRFEDARFDLAANKYADLLVEGIGFHRGSLAAWGCECQWESALSPIGWADAGSFVPRHVQLRGQRCVALAEDHLAGRRSGFGEGTIRSCWARAEQQASRGCCSPPPVRSECGFNVVPVAWRLCRGLLAVPTEGFGLDFERDEPRARPARPDLKAGHPFSAPLVTITAYFGSRIC
jgi:hypothetical protein